MSDTESTPDPVEPDDGETSVPDTGNGDADEGAGSSEEE